MRTTSCACIRTTLVALARIVEVGDEQLDRHATLLARRLPQRGEREHVRELVVVDADDAEIARHLDSEPAGGDDRADRHLVARGHDRRRPVARVAEGVHGRGVAAGEGHVRHDVRDVLGETGIRHRAQVAVQAATIDLRPVRGRIRLRGMRCRDGRARPDARSRGGPRSRRRSRRRWSSRPTRRR